MITSGKSRVAKAAAVVFCGAAAMMVAAPAAHAAAPAITVTPASGLSDGQSVSIGGGGFPAGESIAVVQCNAPSDPAQTSCNYADYVSTVADSSGAVSASIVVRVSFTGTNPGTGQPAGQVDCAAGPCTIAVGSQADPSIFAPPAEITFGG
jgi:hypothetical protein